MLKGLIVIFCVIVGIILSCEFGILIQYLIQKRENKKIITTLYFDEELFNIHIPYNGPDFISRFDIDSSDLRQ